MPKPLDQQRPQPEPSDAEPEPDPAPETLPDAEGEADADADADADGDGDADGDADADGDGDGDSDPDPDGGSDPDPDPDSHSDPGAGRGPRTRPGREQGTASDADSERWTETPYRDAELTADREPEPEAAHAGRRLDCLRSGSGCGDTLAVRSGPGRRAVLAAGAGAAALAAVTMSGTACAVAAAATGRAGGGVPGKGTPGRETASPGEAAPRGTVDRLRALERAHGTTLGVFGRNLATGRTVRYRAGELFPLSGLFTPLAAAALLRDSARAAIPESARTTDRADARAADRATGHPANRTDDRATDRAATPESAPATDRTDHRATDRAEARRTTDRPADATRPADARALAEVVRYSRADLLPDSPVTGAAEHLGQGLSLAALCEAAVRHGDRTAGNLLLRHLGGPGALTRFARSVGDRVTRLDRWEPELNSAEPDRRTDTTTPYAIARTYAHLTVGDALGTADSCLLTGWMRQHTAGAARFRAGLPAGWLLADTTGGGSYGTGHDVGIAWTPEGTPLLLACLTRGSEPGEEPDEALLAATAALLAEVLV